MACWALKYDLHRAAGGREGQMLANNGTASGSISNYASNSYVLDSGVEVDGTLMQRSPLVRTLGPIVGFFRSRAGQCNVVVVIVVAVIFLLYWLLCLYDMVVCVLRPWVQR